MEAKIHVGCERETIEEDENVASKPGKGSFIFTCRSGRGCPPVSQSTSCANAAPNVRSCRCRSGRTVDMVGEGGLANVRPR